jgi:hypothetical protein
MRKTRLLFIGACLYFFMLFDNAYSQRFDGGVVGGLVASQVDGDTYSGFNKTGGIGGVWVSTELARKVAMRLELYYIGKGSRNTSTNPDSSYKMVLHYIELPIMLEYHINKKMYFDAGVGFAYLFGNHEYIGGYEVTPEHNFDRFEISTILGFNYQLMEKMAIRFGYSYSLFPIRPLPTGYNIKRYNGQYNNMLSFSVYINVNKR